MIPREISYIVSGVNFMPDGIEVAYMRLPDDMRSGGKVVATHTYSVTYDHPAYEDEIRELRDMLTDLVKDIAEDFDGLPLAEEDDIDEEDEDEEKGMGE